MKVVLFCGGLGMRMRDGQSNAPKPMAMIGERPMLWHVMRYYAHYGHTDFVLCLGYGASYVKDFFLNYDETRSNDFVLEGGDRQVKPTLLGAAKIPADSSRIDTLADWVTSPNNPFFARARSLRWHE